MPRVRIHRKTIEAQDICAYELVATDDGPLPAFSAGSHVDVHLHGGLVRQYSLCNDPGETHRYLIAVLKDAGSRGGSEAMHDRVNEGDELEISAPKNHFALAHGAAHSVLLAGGIGITPILCMSERLAMIGESFELHYSTRSVARTAFRERINASKFATSVHFHVDEGAPEQQLDLGSLLAQPRAAVHVYVCGPKGFMDAVLGTARSSGWPDAQLHYEFFTAEPAKTDADASFEIKLASSGRVVVVPKDQTVAQALLQAGVEVPTSCEQGICGTCLTRVLAGVPDHRDAYLTPSEQAANDQFTPCCSRAKTARLVLDLYYPGERARR
jgi:vanillate monooxygenase ferredoxin subunit